MKLDLSFSQLISRAFDDYKLNWESFCKVALLSFFGIIFTTLFAGTSILVAAMSNFSSLAGRFGIVLFLFLTVAMLVIAQVFEVIILAMACDIVFKRPLRGFFISKRLMYSAFAYFLYSLMVLFGSVFLIVPGIFLSQALRFANLLVLEGKAGIFESFSISYRMTKGHILSLLWIGCITWLMGVVAYRSLIGIFIIVPMVNLIDVYLYQKLSGVSKDVQAATPSTVMLEE